MLLDLASTAALAVADRLFGRTEPDPLPEAGTRGANRHNGTISLWGVCPRCGGECSWLGVMTGLVGGTKYQLGNECRCRLVSR